MVINEQIIYDLYTQYTACDFAIHAQYQAH